jgi:hypothetical protein
MYIIHNMLTTSNNKNINSLSVKEKQAIWRKRQIDIFYGTGRPIFKITNENQFMRKNYDGNYYIESHQYIDIDNKNFIANNKKEIPTNQK